MSGGMTVWDVIARCQSSLDVWKPRYVLREQPRRAAVVGPAASVADAAAEPWNAPDAEWERIAYAIFDALLPYTEARAAVVAALGVFDLEPRGAT